VRNLSRTILCLGIAVSSLATLSTAAPVSLQSRVVVKGLSAKTEIIVDKWGVPHIYASTPHDAFFAQGWNAARDRLWQMDLWRRSGLGELAAVLGGSYADQDRAIRLFMYRGNMDKEWAAYGQDVKRDTEGFVAGINAYVAATKSDPSLLPQEFKLARYQPAFWKADDIIRIRSHGLSIAALQQLARAQLMCKGGLAAAEFIPRITPPWNPIVPEGLDFCSIPANVLDEYKLAQKPVVFSARGLQGSTRDVPESGEFADYSLNGTSLGSNNWVIGPSRTTTGRPILANDPHREYGVPSLRYIAHLVAPGLNVIGAGEPGLPGIVVGHNEHIAFGVTVFWITQEDLYVYDTNPDNANEYRYRNQWEPMRVVHETVAVRDAPDRAVELKFTRHGPVVMEDPEHHRAYAVRATWLDAGGTPYFGAMEYLRAQTVEEFASALKHWGGPGENQISADTSGKIAWFPAGLTPIRPNSDGVLPVPGDGRYEWNGYLDRDLLPSEIDPARGYIATANQMNLPKDYPYQLRRVGFFWYDDHRFNRISDVIAGSSKNSMEESEKLQNDYVSLPGQRLIAVLNGIQTADPQLKDLIRWLAAWNGTVTADSPQAALYEVWIARHLASAVIAQVVPSMPESLRAAIPGDTSEIVDLVEHPDQRLGPNPEKKRDEIMLTALKAAFEETKQRLGPNRSMWQWGQLATIRFEHPLSVLATEPERERMNVGPAPKTGDRSVVGAAVYNKEFKVWAGASFRMVLDVGQWDNSVAVNTPGQSGNPSSPHYRDLFPLWLNGKYFPLVYSRSAVDKAAERKIVLVPETGGRIGPNAPKD
jgi:penicillin amidase